jgi:GTP cyclohydrolase FolE2
MLKEMQTVSDGKEESIVNWTGSHFFTFWQKKLSTLCPCSETLWEAQLKSDRLVNLMEDISRQSHIQTVPRLLLDDF